MQGSKSLNDNYFGALKAEQELKKATSTRPRAHFATTMLQDGESDDVPSSAFIHDESDDVPSSAFIHSDDYEMVEHGIFPSTTVTYDDLSDFGHHIENESEFTTSPIYDELPQFPCEESHNPHHLSEMSDSTIREIECTYLEGVSEPPHRERVIVDRACEAICISNKLTSTYIVSSHLVLGPIYDDAPTHDNLVLPLEKMMAMVEYDAPHMVPSR